MKPYLRALFAPILNLFESGSEAYDYKPSHRIVLIVMGGLFTALGGIVLFYAQGQDIGYFLPVIIFGGVGIVSLIIGFLGNERAVAKIWGSRS